MTRLTGSGSRAALAALLTLVCAVPSRAAERIEITALGAQTTGDYGSGVATDRQAFVMRLTAGDRTWVRTDLEWSRVQASSDILQTAVGPLPAPGAGERRGMGGASGSGMGEGSGEGGGVIDPGDPLVSSPAGEWLEGPGDVRLTVGRRLLGGGAKLFRLDLQATVKLPTADEEDNLGTGEADWRIGASAEYRLWSASLFAGLGWNQLGDPEWAVLDDVLDAYAGVESEPLSDRWLISGWLEGRQEVIAGTGDRTALGVGFRTVGRLRWQGQATVGLGGSSEDWSATFGVAFGFESPTVGRRGPQAAR